MNKVREIREDKGMTQAELSEATEIGQANLSRIENNKIFTYPKWRKRLAKVLEVKQEELFPEIGDSNDGN